MPGQVSTQETLADCWISGPIMPQQTQKGNSVQILKRGAFSVPEEFLCLCREKANTIGPKTVRSMQKAQNEAAEN